jgi:serine/threonine-protein kinase
MIVKKLGQGGMAAVYQATDQRQYGVVWAIKEMSDSFITNAAERPEALRAFQQEATLLRSLNHPNMPKVVDVFTEGGKHYLVMEYVPGQTLGSMLEARHFQPLPEIDVVPWAVQLCDVLEYLHSQNIIFRDLKPDNIMLTPQGQIKLIDFGIVRFFKPGKSKDTQALGTPGYAAPEASGGQTDGRSDIYSMCATLHQLLTGHDPSTTIYMIPPARQINSSVSPVMDQVLSRGLQAQRTARWTSAGELRAAFMQLPPFASSAGTFSIPLNNATVPPTRTAPKVGGRPTQRLIAAAAQLSTQQLAMIVGGAVLALVVATWILTPVLNSMRVDWNTVPIMGVFGALGYAAFQRRGAAFISHAVFTLAMVLTINARLGWPPVYTGNTLLWGVIFGGVLMEVWVSFIDRVKAGLGDDAWKREIAWLAVMELIGCVMLYGTLFGSFYIFNLVIWIVSALLGAAGWFLGDLFHQYLLFKQTGFRRPPP